MALIMTDIAAMMPNIGAIGGYIVAKWPDIVVGYFCVLIVSIDDILCDIIH